MVQLKPVCPRSPAEREAGGSESEKAEVLVTGYEKDSVCHAGFAGGERAHESRDPGRL